MRCRFLLAFFHTASRVGQTCTPLKWLTTLVVVNYRSGNIYVVVARVFSSASRDGQTCTLFYGDYYFYPRGVFTWVVFATWRVFTIATCNWSMCSVTWYGRMGLLVVVSQAGPITSTSEIFFIFPGGFYCRATMQRFLLVFYCSSFLEDLGCAI